MNPQSFSPSNPLPISAQTVQPHLRRMRFACGLMMGTLPFVAILGFCLPRLRSSLLGPTPLTLLAAAAAAWVGFSANRDARVRLDRIKRAFAVHGEIGTLLRAHMMVYLVVLLRLEIVAVCGLIVAAWGLGPGVGVFFVFLAGVLILMTWPTEHKTLLLVRRATALREP
ncbi:MAG: hypothetical protein K8R59_13010 [Thermoanaerobaculales bacterium]|nr:hypothetical protein [Thermoanaerobaculales bacterium]